MAILKNNVTNETIELILIDPKTGVNWVLDFSASFSDTDCEYDDENDCYIMSGDDIDWWCDIINKHQAGYNTIYNNDLDIESLGLGINDLDVDASIMQDLADQYI